MKIHTIFKSFKVQIEMTSSNGKVKIAWLCTLPQDWLDGYNELIHCFINFTLWSSAMHYLAPKSQKVYVGNFFEYVFEDNQFVNARLILAFFNPNLKFQFYI